MIIHLFVWACQSASQGGFLVGEEENLSEAGRPVREESHHQRQARRFSGKDGEGNSTEDGGLPTKG